MPDIAMCLDHACPSRLTCHRYTAEPVPGRQFYAESERVPEAEKCAYYWPNVNRTAAADAATDAARRGA